MKCKEQGASMVFGVTSRLFTVKGILDFPPPILSM